MLAFNIQKATVYFLLAVISGFLLGSTCLCGHWIALKLAPITNESNKAGKGVQTDDVGGIRLSGMTASLSSNQSHPRTTSGIVRRPTNTNRYLNIINPLCKKYFLSKHTIVLLNTEVSKYRVRNKVSDTLDMVFVDEWFISL